METKGAIEIFLRSVEKPSIKFSTFVDGDSSCFANVAKACIDQDPTYVVLKEAE